MRRILFAVAVMCSMPAWAGGNLNCQLSGTGVLSSYSSSGSGIDANHACLEAVKKISDSVVGTVNSNNGSSGCVSGNVPISGYPFPTKEDASDVCSPCAASNPVLFTRNNGQSCSPGLNVISVSAQTTGTNWGPQYGSTHTYDSTSGTTPDVVTYYGPEDGNVSIEVDANQGLNSTAISSVTLTDSNGTNLWSETHAHTSPDVWYVSGSAVPGRTYNLNITFSHTGGYGEYAVRMSSANHVVNQWTPTFWLGTTQITTSNYTIQYADYVKTGQHMHAELAVSFTSKGTATGNFSIQGLPCSSLTNSGGGTFNGAAGFTGLVAVPTIAVSGTTAWPEKWLSANTGEGLVTNSDITNSLAFNVSFDYICAN